MSLKVKLWGIRGSLPTPHTPQQIELKVQKILEIVRSEPKVLENIPAFLKTLSSDVLGGYGGHTACLEYQTAQQQILVDAGSGIRQAGEAWMAGPCGRGQGIAHILMTHFHWDHLIGLPFFTPIFIPGNEIHFYAVQPDLEENIRRLFKKPNFPVPFERLPSKIHFHQLKARQSTHIGDIEVQPFQLDHPDPCYGYRLKSGGRVIAHCVDTEATRISREDLGADLPLYQNADLMVFDAQYTFLEAAEKVDWGHASGPRGIDVALREGIKKVLFIHHDPAAQDYKIAAAEAQTREYYEACLKAARSLNQEVTHIDWCFAREGMIVEA